MVIYRCDWCLREFSTQVIKIPLGWYEVAVGGCTPELGCSEICRNEILRRQKAAAKGDPT